MHPSIRLLVVSALLPVIYVAGCSGPNVSGNTDVACRPLTVSAASRSQAWGGTVFTIVMENHSSGQILGNAEAPYINGLAAQGAVAAGYHDSFVHPSEPNYIWMVAGENFGILDDSDPGPGHVIGATAHIADQIEHAALSWKSYQESMGEPCTLQSHGTYAVKHNPFAYFQDINGWNGTDFKPPARCAEHLVDYSELDADIAAGTLPDYVFITPNLMDDMHDGTIADGDAWLSREVPKILATDAYRKGGVLFLLWDEGQNAGDDPPFIVMSPSVKPGYRSKTPYDTSSYLLTVQRILALDDLPCSAQPGSVQPMSDLFSVALPPKK